MVAFFHHTDRLGVKHTVSIGEPWLPRSTLDSFLLSLPYPFGPDLGEAAGRPRVDILWLLPITPAERAFKREHGAEALEQLFERNAIEYWGPQRPCVVGSAGG